MNLTLLIALDEMLACFDQAARNACRDFLPKSASMMERGYREAAVKTAHWMIDVFTERRA